MARGTLTNFKDKKIGTLLVLEIVEGSGGRGKHYKWKCLCDCGEFHIAPSQSLSRKPNITCNKCRSLNHRSKETIKSFIFSNMIRAAKDRELEFTLTKEYITELYLEQNGKCAISKLDIIFAPTSKEHLQCGSTASLDRIDSSKGYIIGNVQWVHKRINFMKSDMTQSEFVAFCKAVAENA